MVSIISRTTLFHAKKISQILLEQRWLNTNGQFQNGKNEFKIKFKNAINIKRKIKIF
jgi:hypothetical protein